MVDLTYAILFKLNPKNLKWLTNQVEFNDNVISENVASSLIITNRPTVSVAKLAFWAVCAKL